VKELPTNTLNFEKIRAWLNEPDAEEITPEQRLIYDRWDFAYDQLKLERPPSVARRLMLKYGVSRSTAYNDIGWCQKLLNPINRRDLEWVRNYLVEDAILQVNAARTALDMRAWDKASTRLLKLYAIERDEKDGIDPELLGNNNYYITVNFGDKVEKINLDELSKLPEKKRMSLTEAMFGEIDIEDAKTIMES